MLIAFRFDLDLSTPLDRESGWQAARFSAGFAADPGDPFDIRDGGDAAPYHRNNGQTANDAQALSDFIAMLMAILDQLLNWRSAGAEAPGQKSRAHPGAAGNVFAGSTAGGDNIGGKFTPVPVVAASIEPADIADHGQDRQQAPQGTAQPKTPGPSIDGKEGVAAGSTQLVSTGTGTGHYFNVTNNTDRAQTFAFSSNSSNTSGYSNNVNAVMTLQPGETGTFEAGDNVPGIRINTSGPNGETHGNEALYEDTIGVNPMDGRIVHNPDVSNVDGKLSYDGRPQRITVSDGTRSIGDGTETGVYDYDVEDRDPNPATNPMNMALDPATSYSIVFSDG